MVATMDFHSLFPAAHHRGASFLKQMLLFLLLVVSTSSSSSQFWHQSADRSALLSFKSHIENDPLGALSSWNDSLHHCRWNGITCSRRHRERVTVLDLPSQRLGGTLSPYIWNLTFLRQINLNYNLLSGEISVKISSLSKLHRLYLAFNNITGVIPSSLGNLSKLGGLYLAFNNITGVIPSSLGNLSSLTALSLIGNQLEGRIPDSLCRIRSLEFFQVGDNKLTGELPSCLHNLSNIVYFGVRSNQLKRSLPPNLGLTLLPNIQMLDLSSNSFSGEIPTSLSNSTRLEWISFDYNNFTGPVPRDLGRLHALTYLSLHSNQLGTKDGDNLDFITSLTNCSNLQFLDFEENLLKGSLPESISYISRTRIRSLYAAGNRIYGNIPVGIENLVNIHGIHLSDNYLTGNIPAVIGKLNNLLTLDISRNRLSGHIPALLGECFSLLRLDLDDNFLNGKIPESINGLRSLEYLYLAHNNLSGEIPKYLELLPLIEVDLSFNQFQGQVPLNGVFRNKSSVSIVGNYNLCGGIMELKLPSCIQSEHKSSFSIKVTVSLVIGSLFLLVLLCVLFIGYRKIIHKKKPSSTTVLNQTYRRVSYAELFRATDGFSKANLIGVGSYGSVYRGSLEEISKPIAVKVLNLQREGASKSFQTECKALRNLRHRNLLKVITSCSTVDFQENDFKALVFEYMPNGSLEEWLHQKHQSESRNLDFIQRLGIAIHVAFALEYLHNHCQPGIVHCDIKPSNVLLDDDMTGHVADFGIAKFFASPFNDSTQSLASSVVLNGSVGYVAPEYGLGCEVSTRGDVYSYGILLLEMFTRKKPTDGMFLDGFSLHNYCKKALPNQVMEIVDTMVLVEKQDEVLVLSNMQDRLQECLVSTIRLGVACSVESPMERMTMSEVLSELRHISDHHQGVGAIRH